MSEIIFANRFVLKVIYVFIMKKIPDLFVISYQLPIYRTRGADITNRHTSSISIFSSIVNFYILYEGCRKSMNFEQLKFMDIPKRNIKNISDKINCNFECQFNRLLELIVRLNFSSNDKPIGNDL